MMFSEGTGGVDKWEREMGDERRETVGGLPGRYRPRTLPGRIPAQDRSRGLSDQGVNIIGGQYVPFDYQRSEAMHCTPAT